MNRGPDYVRAAVYGIQPCAYDIPGHPGTKIERRYSSGQRYADPGDDTWAITRFETVLNRAGEWEYEPQPSSRTEDFIARTRYPLREAIIAAVEYFGLSRKDDGP